MAAAAQPGTGADRAARRIDGRRPVVAVLRSAPRAPSAVHPTTYDVVPVLIDRRIVDRVLTARPDAVVIDVDGGQFDLIRLCQALRSAIATRIVVVSTEALDDDLVVEALDAGADDVVIGASPAVVEARVRVALRTQPVAEPLPEILEFGDVVIDLRAHEVRVAGSPVRCPPVQYELLVALARHPGTAIAGEELLRTVWGTAPGDVHPRRLRIAVSVLRNVLGIGAARPRVETVPRIGYRLVVPA